MVKELYIENFKSISKTLLEIKPITILIGENSSGKSSVLQLLALLNQLKDSRNAFPIGNLSNIGLGEFKEILRKTPISAVRFQRNNKMIIGLEFPNVPPSSSIDDMSNGVTWELSMEQDPYCEVTAIEVRLPNFVLRTEKVKTSSNSYEEKSSINGERVKDNDPKVVIPKDTAKMLNLQLSRKIKDPFYEELFQQLGIQIENFANNIIYLPPFRGIRRPGYPLKTRMPDTLGESISEGFENNIVNILNWMASERLDKLQLLNKALDKYLQAEIRQATQPTRDPKPLTTILVEDKVNGIHSTIANTGFGTNQVIAMGVGMLYLDKPSLIAIEEPEIHLHPRAQADIFDFINELRRKHRVLIATHSDHFLVRMQQRIRQGRIKSLDVAIYYFERTDQGARISKRSIDKKGRFEGGMPGFFEHNLDELQKFIKSESSSK